MKFRWSALVVVLALGLLPQAGLAQGTSPGGQRQAAAKLGQNYPNPFNPETFFPFELGDPQGCAEGKQYKVSLRVYNVLTQLVSVPVIQGGAGSVAGGQPLDNVLLPCGQYTAYWNGKYRNTSQDVASGVYVYVLEVDGRRIVKKGTVTK